ncbi:MAG: DUF6159 family protein [Thermoplasmata archaeon]
MGRIGTGWQLTKVSFGVIRKDKELLLFPFLALIVSGLMWGLFLASIFILDIAFIEQIQEQSVYLYYALYFLFYFLTAFIAIYFQAAVVGSAMIRLEGGSPTIGDAFRQANKHVGKLFKWALLTATVGLILRAIARRGGFIGRIIAGALGITWTLASYMAIPVVVAEGLGPWAALKRSASLFRKTWGETLVGGLGMGVILVLLAFLGIIPLIAGVYLVTNVSLLVGLVVIAVAVIYWFIIFLVWGAAWPILSAVLYRYAAQGKVAPGVPEDLIRTSIQV